MRKSTQEIRTNQGLGVYSSCDLMKKSSLHSEDRVTTLAKIFLSIFSKTPGIFFSKIACIAMIWIFRGLLKFFGHSTKTQGFSPTCASDHFLALVLSTICTQCSMRESLGFSQMDFNTFFGHYYKFFRWQHPLCFFATMVFFIIIS